MLPLALRMLPLQLLHALLQPIDPLLALYALARKHVALPFLRGLLELLYALLTLELPLFCLQQALLLALRARAFRLLRLQFLYTLLQPIDALLALHAPACRCVVLPPLQGLPRLLNGLLNALFALADPLLLRGTRGQRGRCARTRRCRDSRRGVAGRGGDLRHRTRRHGWTLWRRSRPERRCGGPRHGGRRCGASHRRRWCRTCHRRWRGPGHRRMGRGPPGILGIRADACCNYNCGGAK